jgi:hypothetical protein
MDDILIILPVQVGGFANGCGGIQLNKRSTGAATVHNYASMITFDFSIDGITT